MPSGIRLATDKGGTPHGEDAKEEVFAFSSFHRAQWRKLWSSNPLERLNRELKRRCKVVGILSNEASVIRLSGSVLLDIHEEWVASDRRYLSEPSMAQLSSKRDDHDAEVDGTELVD